MILKEILFCIVHPKAAVEAKLRQVEVAIKAGGSPAGSTIEEFSELPVSQAAALIYAAQQSEKRKDGVQLKDWSEADQERMLRGECLQGTPFHRNL